MAEVLKAVDAMARVARPTVLSAGIPELSGLAAWLPNVVLSPRQYDVLREAVVADPYVPDGVVYVLDGEQIRRVEIDS